jgi:hypothetical protein
MTCKMLPVVRMARVVSVLLLMIFQHACVGQETENVCVEACTICNLSDADLQLRFATSEIPSKYKWACRFQDSQEAFSAYQHCVKNREPLDKCTTAALGVCMKRCLESQ